MSLFIQLYLDEDVDILVADLLEAYGFSALTTRDAGQLQNTDAEQLLYMENGINHIVYPVFYAIKALF